MASYRTSMQIVADLLDATQQSGQEGIKTTSLTYKGKSITFKIIKILREI